MEYEIEVKETLSRVTTYRIKVDDEGEGMMIENMLEDDIEDAGNIDDVEYTFEKHNVEVISRDTGVLDATYEIY